MKILYHIPNLSQENGGIRQYAVALLRILAQDKSNEYFVLHNVNDPQVMQVLEEFPHLHHVPPTFGRERKLEKLRTDIGTVFNYILLLAKRQKLASTSYINRICRKYKIDIVHCPHQFAAVTNRKVICTMHDVQELHFPEFFSPRDRFVRAFDYLDALDRADKVVVSYQHIKDDLLKYFDGLKEDDIQVCLLEMQNLWFEKLTTADQVDLSTLDYPDRFLLYPANTWPHKNHKNLVEAVHLLAQSDKHVNVICTGHQRDYYHEEIAPLIEKYQLKDQFIFPSIVDEKQLYTLYQKCVGVVVPTLYEAGSFPLMESILMNVPVICAKTTSLPETIGNQEFVFSPTDPNKIAELMWKLWNEEDFRTKAKANNLERQPYLTNTNSLGIMQSIYQSLSA
ncbi:MAG: glycosyltransferase family 1 protein [Bacteroidota bacterium]